MPAFFDYNPVPPGAPGYIEAFGAVHFATLGLVALLGALIVIYRSRFRPPSGSEALGNRVRYGATAVAVGLEIGLHAFEYLTAPFYQFLRGVIPLHLCVISLWLSVALNLTKSRRAYELLYFWGLGGLVSLIFLNTDGEGLNRFRFYQYVGVHAYILLTVVWFTAVNGYRVGFRSLLRATLLLLAVSVAVRYFDLAFSAEPYVFNYMYVVSPPEVSSPLDGVGTGWPYYFAFALMTVAVFAVAWLPWGIAALAKRPRASTRT